MAFVLDCSMTMAWLFLDEANSATDALRDSLLKDHAIAPVLWPIEVGNVLLVATRRGRITREDWSSIRTDLAALPIEVEPPSDDRVLARIIHELRPPSLVPWFNTTYSSVGRNH